MNDTTIEEMEKITKDFSEKYGELLLLKANIAAINKMLIKRGREQELFDSFKKTIEDFEKNNENKANFAKTLNAFEDDKGIIE
jgi:hypothetical protein